MTKRVVDLAEHLLRTYSEAEVRELTRILSYFNGRVIESDRVKALRYGTVNPENPALEAETRSEFTKSGNQSMYVATNSNVCKYCGK